MEAVPRMSMLSLELKESAERVEFGPVIKPYIRQHYMENESKYTEEIRQIDQLRINACNVTRDFNGISVLKKYYGQLHLLTSRFPMGEGGAAALPFTWMDTFDEEPFTHVDVAYEQACILYNLGSLHSFLGAKVSRSSEEEMKVACTHFQCAAGAFTYLRDHFHSDMSPDISFELMTIYINVMLGQAQECLLEKSMQDNRKSSLVARISIQVVDYYRQAMRGLDDSNISSLLGSKKSKTWKKVLTIKIHHYTSLAYMFMGNQAEEQQKYGERVAYLQLAVDKHNEAVKLVKGQHESLVDALNFTKDVVVGKFQSAKKDNDFVYHDTVPSSENLTEIKGASLVKALTYQPYDESVAGPDIFRKLVPMEAHEASSLYSEEKAKLLRKVSNAIEEKNKNLDQFMSALGELNLQQPEPERLPQMLMEVCAAISVKQDPIKTLITSMQALSNVVLDVDLAVKELGGILQEEDQQEQAFQKEFGSRPINIVKDIKKEFGKYQEGHNKASRSNQELHKAMEAHIDNIRALAGPLEELQAMLPSSRDAERPEDNEAKIRLQKLVAKVDEMKTQRQSLETQLRDQVQHDDITSQIVTKEGGNMKEFFEEELKKHNTICTYIDQNLSAQDNILKAVTDANAAYADTKKMSTDTAKRREDKVQELITSYTVYDDLIAKSHKGTEFYKKLEQGITKLLSKTKGVVKVNQEEREAMIQKVRPKPAPARPSAPKPSAPVDNAPRGPRLSDFWQPKSKKSGAADTSTNMGPPPGALNGMAHQMYPDINGSDGAPGGANVSGPGGVNVSSTGPTSTSMGPPPGASNGLPHHMYPGIIGPDGKLIDQSATRNPMIPEGAPGGADLSRSGGVSVSTTGPIGVSSSAGTESHPGAPGIAQTRHAPANIPGGHGSPSHHPPGGMQSPVHPPQMGHPMSGGQPRPVSQVQPMRPIASRPSNIPTQPGIAPQPNQVQPGGQQGMVNQPSRQPQVSHFQQPPSSVHQPPSSYQPSGQTQQRPETGQVGVQPTSMGFAPTAPPSQPHSSVGQQYPPPQLQHQPTAPQGYNAPGQWQQPKSQPPSSGAPQALQQPPVASAYQPQTSMTMVSSNPTPITTPVQQNTGGPGQVPYSQGYVPSTSGQGGYQSTQMGVQQPPPVRPQAQIQPMQHPHQQQFAPQQQQIRMQQPGLQQPATLQQPGGQLQQQQQQPLPHGQSQTSQGGSGIQQHGQSSHMYHQHSGQPHSGGPQQYVGQQQIPGVQQQQPVQQQHPGQQHIGQPQHPNQQQHLSQQQYPNQQHPGQQQHFSQQPAVQQHPNVQQHPKPVLSQPGQQQPHLQQHIGQQQIPTQQRPSQPGQPQHPSSQPQPGPQHIGAQQFPAQNLGPQQQMYHQQPPGSPQHQLSASSQQQPATSIYGQQQPQVPSSQHQQTPAGVYQTQHGMGVPPVQQHPSGSVLPPQQPGNLQNQPRIQPQTQPGRPVQSGSPLAQPQGSPQHLPNVVPSQIRHGMPQQSLPGMTLPPGQPQQQHQQGQIFPSPNMPNQQRYPAPPTSQQQVFNPAQNQPYATGVQPQPNQLGMQRPQQPGAPSQQMGMQRPPHPGSQYVVPGGPGSPQHFPRPQGPPQQGVYPQGVQGQNIQQHQVGGVVNQPPMSPLPQQAFQQPGPAPQQYPQPGGPQQQYNYQQQPPGAPLTKSQQNQQINRALKEEQQRLPQPSLQPVKAEPKDLLSASPDSVQKSLADAQVLQPLATTTTAVDPNSSATTVVDSAPQQRIQTYTTPPTVQSGIAPHVDHRTEYRTQPLSNEGSNTQGPPKDPYGDKDCLDRFVEEVERFEYTVEGLSKQMLSGPTVLEKNWKELSDAQDRDSRQYSMAVARCYSMKNRHADIMPYDHNRILLKNSKDDYINGSCIKDLSPTTPPFIATQAPVLAAINDFWLMVFEQNITIIAALISDPPVGGKSTGFDQYWSEERGQVQTYGPIMLTLKNIRRTDYQVERIFNLMHKETKQMRTLFHLQFTAWPEFGVLSNPAKLIQFIGEVNNYYKQQRSLQTPVLVHCNCGVGTTGVFCVIYTAIQEMQAGNGIINIPQVITNLRQQRKWMITNKEQLKFCYDAVLVCAQQMLAKHGVMTRNPLSSPAYDPKRVPSKNSFDAIIGADSVESLQTKISQMTVKPQPEPSEEGESQTELGGGLLEAIPSTDHNVIESAPPMQQTEQSHPPIVPLDQSSSVEHNTNVGLLDFNTGGGTLGFTPDSPSKMPGSGLISPDGSTSSSLQELQESNLSFFSQSATHNFIPDVVESTSKESADDESGSGMGKDVKGSNSSLPSILADLTPQNFSIKEKPPSKQKVTKADFESGKSRLGEQKNEDDPFSMLDPMWSIGKAQTGSQESK